MRTLWSFLVVAALFLSAGRCAAADPQSPNPGSSAPSGGSDKDGKKDGKLDKQACAAALEKDYQGQKTQLEAALKGAKPLKEYWSGECEKGKEPKEIVAGLLGSGEGSGKAGAPGKDGKPGSAAPAMSQDSVNAVGASVSKLTAADYHMLFDGQSLTFADLKGPAGAGMGGARPTPADVAPSAGKLTPQAVRDMLADPGLKNEKLSSDALQADFRKAFEQTAHGRELLKEWKANGISGVPILVGPSQNPKEGAAFHPDGNFYSINSDQLAKSYPWAKGKDEPALAAFLASHPAERAALVYDLQGTMIHEGWHSVQMAKVPLHGKYDVPDKDYVQMEYEAKMKGAGSYMERVEAERKAGKSTLATRDNVFVNEERMEALRLAYQGPDQFQKYIKNLYLTSTNGADLSDGIKLQRDRIKNAPSAAEKAKLEAGLKQLEAAKAYFDKRVPVVAKSETAEAPAFLVHHGMDLAATKPNDAMNALYAGAQDARQRQPKWFAANRTKVIDSFNTAIDAEKALMKKECVSPSPACQKRQQDLEGSCKYIGRDPC